MSDYVVTRKRRRTYTQAIDPCLGYYLHAAADDATRSGAPQTIPPPKVLGARVENWRERTRSTVPTSFDGERELEIPFSELGAAAVLPGTPRRRYATGSAMAENAPRVSENTSVLTVEEFLKRSSDSERNPHLNLRRYRGKRRAGRLQLVIQSSPEDTNKSHQDSEEAVIRLRSRNIPRGELADSELDTSSHLMTSSPGYEPLSSSSPLHDSGKPVRPRKKPRQGKNLRKRLYEAAVSTYGYIDPNFMDTAAAARPDDTLDPQTRVKPLRFVPGSGIQHRTRSPRNQNRRKFVDPRKTNAIRTASFLSLSKDRTARIACNSDSAVLMNVLDRLPAEKWVLDLESEESPSAGRNSKTSHQPKSTLKRKHSKDPALTTSGQIYECPPLTFIDFKQAEASYANIFSMERNGAEGAKKTSTPHLAPALKLTLKDTHKSASSGSPIVAAPSSGNRLMVSNHPVPNLQMIELTACTKNKSTIEVASQPLPDELDPGEPLHTESAVPAVKRTPKFSRRRRQGDSPQTNCHMETPNPTRSDKPLRPLVSFMDEFFENIRNVGTRGG